MSATLTVARRGNGFELRRGPFEISVDGNHLGTINRKETIEKPLTPGHHTLRVHAGRYSSPERSFDVNDGEVVNYRCFGANLWPIYVASIVKPDLGIALRPD